MSYGLIADKASAFTCAVYRVEYEAAKYLQSFDGEAAVRMVASFPIDSYRVEVVT